MATTRIGGAWVRKTNSGESMVKIQIDIPFVFDPRGYALVLLEAREKRSDTSPDYNVILATRGDDDQQRQSLQPRATNQAGNGGDFSDQRGGDDPFANE